MLSVASLAELPNLRRLALAGISGPLESTMPPITVPAWTSMLTGRDPGELGIYGFRNRRTFDYGDLVSASSGMVSFPRLWDYVAEAGGDSIVVGVPQTSPAPAVRGVLVSGFEAQGLEGITSCHPADLTSEIDRVVGDYRFDVASFRHSPLDQVLTQIYAMTESRFKLMSHLLNTRHWDFAMLCEIAPDRLHHCFWSYHDPLHPRYKTESLYRNVICDYYRYLDDWIGCLVQLVGPECGVLIVSDHGAKAMLGGVCINEILLETGWLVLREIPSQPIPLQPQLVDWTRTRAWAEGGYYARIFLNIKNREPQGVIPIGQRNEVRLELSRLLETLSLPFGPTIKNDVLWPEDLYRRVRGIPPDLLVFFGGLNWRSLGTVGHGRTWLVGNDTGLDEANHARDGFFLFQGPGVSHRGQRASILDIAPTALQWLCLTPPDDLTGTSLLADHETRGT